MNRPATVASQRLRPAVPVFFGNPEEQASRTLLRAAWAPAPLAAPLSAHPLGRWNEDHRGPRGLGGSSGAGPTVGGPTANWSTAERQALRQRLIADPRMQGFTLVETILVMAGISAMSLGVYGLYRLGQPSSKAAVEQTDLSILSQNLVNSYTAAGTYQNVSNATAIGDKLVPSRMLTNDGNIMSVWGTPVTVGPDPSDNTRLAINYTGVPTNECVRLASAMANAFYDIRVQGQSVLNGQGNLNVSQVSSACNVPTGASMAFIQSSGNAGAGLDLPPLATPPAPPAIPPAPSLPGSGNNTPPYTPPAPYTPTPSTAPSTPATPPIVIPPAPTAGSSPAPGGSSPAPVTPPPYTPPVYSPTCVLPSPAIQTRTQPCPQGQVAKVAPYNADGITQTSSAACPGPFDSPVWSNWATVSNACAPICVAQAPQTQTVACPAGQLSSTAPYGTNGITQTRTSTCATPVADPAYGAWTTTGNTCTPVCVVQAPQTQTLGCPAGQLGAITQTRTSTCATPVAQPTYGVWVTTGNTCAPVCAAPAPTTQVNTGTGACPAGQVLGNGASTFGQSQSRSVTYSCPAPTGPYSTTIGAYGPWSPTAAQAGCAPICYAPAPQQQFAACPAGQAVPGPFPANYYGVQQQRDGGCTAPNGTPYYGGWYNTGYVACAPVCSAPPPAQVYVGQQWGPTIAGNCGPGESGTYTYHYLQNLYDNYSYACGQVTGGATQIYNGRTAVNTTTTAAVTNTCRATCVSIDAFVVVRRQGRENILRAGEVRVGDELKLVNPGNGATRWGRVSESYTETVDMVRVVTADAVNLRCSTSAPIGLADGGHLVAADLLGHTVAIEVDGVYGASRVEAVEALGQHPVQMITCENDFFLAGDVAGRYLAHHNKKNGSGCVAPTALVVARRDGQERIMTAGEVRLGDWLKLMDPATGETRWGPVVIAKRTQNTMVQLTTASGAVLDCSGEAPLGRTDGVHVFAQDLLGASIAVEQDGRFVPSEVIAIERLSTTEVCHLHCEGGSFLVGNIAGRYLVHE